MSKYEGGAQRTAIEVLERDHNIYFLDSEYKLLYMGSRPILIQSTADNVFLSPNATNIKGLDVGASVVSAAFSGRYIVFSLAKVPNALANESYSISITRGWPYVLGALRVVQTPPASVIGGAPPTKGSVETTGRRLLQTTTATATATVVKSEIMSNATYTFFSNGDVKIIPTDATSSDPSFAVNMRSQWGNVTDVLRIAPYFFIMGTGTSGRWQAYRMVDPRFVESYVNISNIIRLAGCGASGPICTALSKCIYVNSTGRLACGMIRADSVGLVSFDFMNPQTSTSVYKTLQVTSGLVVLSCMALDMVMNQGFIAFAIDENPSVLYKFSLDDLLASGTYRFVTVGLDREIASSIHIDSVSRSATVTIALPFSYSLVPLNLYGIMKIEPVVADSRGGTVITVTGEGFGDHAEAFCMFGSDPKNTVGAIVRNSTTMTCVAPTGGEEGGSCQKINFNLMFGKRATTNTNVNIQRPSSPILESLITAEGVDFGGKNRVTKITVLGFGFINSPYMKCKLEASNPESFSPITMSVAQGTARYINTSAIECTQPITPNASKPPARITISLDGTIYTNQSLLYSVVGDADNFIIRQPKNYSKVMSSFATYLPIVEIDIVDKYLNRLGWLDKTVRRMVIKEPQVEYPPQSLGISVVSIQPPTWSWDTLPMNISHDGVVRYTRMAFTLPVVSNVVIKVVEANNGKDEWEAFFVISVIVGEPHHIQLETDISVWTIAAEKPDKIQTEPSLFIADVAGNSIKDMKSHALPAQMYIEYLLARLNVSGGKYTDTLERLSASVDASGEYRFPGVNTLGMYGHNYQFRFFVIWPGIPVKEYITPRIPIAKCATTEEYGHPDDIHCRRCPANAQCDATMHIQVNPNYWRPALDAYEFYSCSDSCLNGTCIEGYQGAQCSSCIEGYGKSGRTCQKCGNQIMNGILIVIILIAFALALYVLIVNSLGNGARKKDQLPILIKMFMSHLQVCSQIGSFAMEMPPIMGSIFSFQGQAGGSLGSINFSAMDCESHFDYYDKWTMMMLLPWAIFAIIGFGLFGADIMQIVKAYIIKNRKLNRQEMIEKKYEDRIRGRIRARRESVMGFVDVVPQEKPKLRGVQRFRELVHQIILDNRAAQQAVGKFTIGDKIIKRTTIVELAKQAKEIIVMEKGSKFKTFLLSVVIVMFLFYPTLVEQCAMMLKCDPVNFGETQGYRDILTNDRTIVCWTSQHFTYVALALAFAMIYGIGIPLFSFGMVKLVAYLAHGDMVVATGSFFFMCGGFRRERWFWEEIVMLRKAFMVFIVVFITHKAIQTYCGMWLIGTMLLLNTLNQPYSLKLLSKLEAASLATIALTLNLGLLFGHMVKDSPGYWILSIFLLIINVSTMLLFLFFIWKAALLKIQTFCRDNVEKVRPTLNMFPSIARLLDLEDLVVVLTKGDVYDEKGQRRRASRFSQFSSNGDDEDEEVEENEPAISILIPQSPDDPKRKSMFEKFDNFLSGAMSYNETPVEPSSSSPAVVKGMLRKSILKRKSRLTPILKVVPVVHIKFSIASLTAKRDSLKNSNDETRARVARLQRQKDYLQEEHDKAQARLRQAQAHHDSVAGRFRKATVLSFEPHSKKKNDHRQSVVFAHHKLYVEFLEDQLGGFDAPPPLMSHVEPQEYVLASEGSHPPLSIETDAIPSFVAEPSRVEPQEYVLVSEDTPPPIIAPQILATITRPVKRNKAQRKSVVFAPFDEDLMDEQLGGVDTVVSAPIVPQENVDPPPAPQILATITRPVKRNKEQRKSVVFAPPDEDLMDEQLGGVDTVVSAPMSWIVPQENVDPPPPVVAPQHFTTITRPVKKNKEQMKSVVFAPLDEPTSWVVPQENVLASEGPPSVETDAIRPPVVAPQHFTTINRFYHVKKNKEQKKDDDQEGPTVSVPQVNDVADLQVSNVEEKDPFGKSWAPPTWMEWEEKSQRKKSWDAPTWLEPEKGEDPSMKTNKEYRKSVVVALPDEQLGPFEASAAFVPQDLDAVVAFDDTYDFEAPAVSTVPPLDVTPTTRRGSKKNKEQRNSVSFTLPDEKLGVVDTVEGSPVPPTNYDAVVAYDPFEAPTVSTVPPLDVTPTTRRGSKKNKEQRNSVSFTLPDEKLGVVDTVDTVDGGVDTVVSPPLDAPPPPVSWWEQRQSVVFAPLDEELGGVDTVVCPPPPMSGLQEYVFAPESTHPDPHVEMDAIPQISPDSPTLRRGGTLEASYTTLEQHLGNLQQHLATIDVPEGQTVYVPQDNDFEEDLKEGLPTWVDGFGAESEDPFAKPWAPPTWLEQEKSKRKRSLMPATNNEHRRRRSSMNGGGEALPTWLEQERKKSLMPATNNEQRRRRSSMNGNEEALPTWLEQERKKSMSPTNNEQRRRRSSKNGSDGSPVPVPSATLERRRSNSAS